VQTYPPLDRRGGRADEAHGAASPGLVHQQPGAAKAGVGNLRERY
jgi:hypothetical protein